MSKNQFKIKPKVWPKEYTFEEFKRLNPNINESLLINYYNKYLQEYAENRSRHIEHFEDNKKLLANNLQEVKNRYDDSQYFLQMYYYNQPDAVGGFNKPFSPTDIGGLTHWFKVESSSIQSQDIVYNATTNVQEVVSWSSAVGDSHLVKDSVQQAGYFANDFVTFFRGQTYTGGNTGGQRMKLTDSPRFGAFTYFGVLEFNYQVTKITARNQTNSTSSVIYNANFGTDRTIEIQQSTNVSENYRLVFINNSLVETIRAIAADNFSEEVLVANIESFMSEEEKIDGRVSGSTLGQAVSTAINTLRYYTSSFGSTTATFYKYPEISRVTNLPHDGNFYNAAGEAETLVITSNFGGGIIQVAQTINQYHGIWAGQKINVGGTMIPEATNNNMHVYGRPIAITGSMRLFFGMAASSSIDSGDTTGTVEQISSDPDHNQKFVFMVTKDASENATVKVYVNNVSVFPEGSEAAGNLDLDELAHFEPKYFGYFNAQNRTLNGKVYEMGFYDTALSNTDRTQLYYYLGLKHNVHNYDGANILLPYNYPDTGYLP